MPKKIKKANKNAAKGGKKMWKKHQSSSFNPSFNKHRLEAKKRAMFGVRGEGNLTEAKLAIHNKLTTDSQCDQSEEAMSVGGETAMTAFTNCSLPTFNRLLKNWNSNSFLHKEMLAIIAAVTDILKMKDGKETETEYFAALMTTLDIVQTDESLTAVICLLSMLARR
ncbi:RRP12-like protein [Uloborus diversus]|nr:RRP12-like protein [Uloborus diversus]